MSCLHVFDLDGTLLRGTTASLEIGRRLGLLPELRQLEAAFANGEVDTAEFASEIYGLWRELTPQLVEDAFANAPWIGGIADVFADIRQRGEKSVVMTMSPNFFATHLIALGVDEVVASTFPPIPFASPLDPAGILTPADKVAAVDRVRTAIGLDRDSCVAYGDSASDIPLFQALKHTVAINATDSLRKIARYEYNGDDLKVAYQIARRNIHERGIACDPA